MRDEEKVAKPPQLAQTGWCGQELFDHTTPSAPQRRLRYFFLVSRPPSCCSGGEFRVRHPEFFESGSKPLPDPVSVKLYFNSDRFEVEAVESYYFTGTRS